MKSESFYNHGRYRWFWINFAFVVAATVFYVLHAPLGGPSGGSELGLVLGILAAIGMLILMWYSARKRAYHAKHTTLKGALSFHVWLGTALIIIVPLHAGFSFGPNVHTLAFVLMALTILTGIWGGLNYQRLAPEIESHRGGGSVALLLEEFETADKEIEQQSKGKSDQLISMVRTLDIDKYPSLLGSLFGKDFASPDSTKIANLLSTIPQNDKDEALRIVASISKKTALLNRIQKEVRTMFYMRAWLYLHLPLAAAAFVALIIHILTVLRYW